MRFKTRLLHLALLAASCSASLLAYADTMCQIKDAVTVQQSVWTLCARNALYVTSDMGKTWQSVSLPPETLYRGLFFVDARRAFIVGDAGTLLASEDGGKTWAPRKIPATDNLTAITFVGESGWIVGHGGLVLHTSDGGKTWARQETKLPQGLASVFFIDAQNGWTVGWVGVALRTKDGGKTWERREIADATWSLTSVHFRDAKNGWILGMFGQMLRTKDGGETWELQKVPTKGQLTALYFDAAGRGYATVDNDVLTSQDKGEKWDAAGILQWLFLRRLVQVGNTVWAIGTFQIMQFDSAKKQWVLLPNVPSSQT
jgi:photosystem II stability/assembly factor-like uncharacterized protein